MLTGTADSFPEMQTDVFLYCEGTFQGKLNSTLFSSFNFPGRPGVFFAPYSIGEASLFWVPGQLTSQQYNQ